MEKIFRIDSQIFYAVFRSFPSFSKSFGCSNLNWFNANQVHHLLLMLPTFPTWLTIKRYNGFVYLFNFVFRLLLLRIFVRLSRKVFFCCSDFHRIVLFIINILFSGQFSAKRTIWLNTEMLYAQIQKLTSQNWMIRFTQWKFRQLWIHKSIASYNDSTHRGVLIFNQKPNFVQGSSSIRFKPFANQTKQNEWNSRKVNNDRNLFMILC